MQSSMFARAANSAQILDSRSVEQTNIAPGPSHRRRQKLSRIEPCITRGVRAVVGVPNVFRVICTVAEQMLPATVQAAPRLVTLHQTESQRAVDVIKIRVIEDVVDLPAQLQLALFSDRKVLEDSDVVVERSTESGLDFAACCLSGRALSD